MHQRHRVLAPPCEQGEIGRYVFGTYRIISPFQGSKKGVERSQGSCPAGLWLPRSGRRANRAHQNAPARNSVVYSQRERGAPRWRSGLVVPALHDRIGGTPDASARPG